jgi:glycine/serine hydroxymethyltransferase
MKEAEMEIVADLIDRALSDLTNAENLAAVKRDVISLTENFKADLRL